MHPERMAKMKLYCPDNPQGWICCGWCAQGGSSQGKGAFQPKARRALLGSYLDGLTAIQGPGLLVQCQSAKSARIGQCQLATGQILFFCLRYSAETKQSQHCFLFALALTLHFLNQTTPRITTTDMRYLITPSLPVLLSLQFPCAKIPTKNV